MQPSTPFNTHSRTLMASEFLGWFMAAVLFWSGRWTGLSTGLQVALVTAWASYTLLRIFSLRRWYPGATRGEGLEQHFAQMKVVAIYGFFAATVAAVSHILSFLIYPIAVVMGGVTLITLTLIYLYKKDKSAVPINFYSHRKFLREEES